MDLPSANGGAHGHNTSAAPDDEIRTPAPSDATPLGPETTPSELRAYYLFSAGDNGVTHLCFGAAAFQSLLDRASNKDGNLYFAGVWRNVESSVLLANGISFTIQAILFVILGGYADFGSLRPKVLIFWSIVAFAAGFAWLWVYTPEQWQAGVTLYVIGLTSFEMSMTYFIAAFPRLARDTPNLRNAAAAMAAGKITRKQYEQQDMLQRSQINNYAFTAQSFGAAAILAVMSVFIYILDFESSPARNSWGLSIIIAFTTLMWLLLALPWFFLEQKRPGQPVPRNMSIMRAGIHQLQQAAKNIWVLKQSLIYLICFFLLCDSLNTSFVVFTALQYKLVEFRTSTVTNMLMVSMISQGLGTYTCLWLQRKLAFTTKQMLLIIILGHIVMDAWGLIGNFTTAFGFHQIWEVWLWQIYFGFFVCPWWSYGFIMVSSVTPRGYESMFFSIFGVAGKTSSLIGPFVTSAIVHATPGENRDWAPFYFLFGLSAVSGIVFWICVDEGASAAEQEQFLASRKQRIHEETAHDAFELGALVPESDRSSLDT